MSNYYTTPGALATALATYDMDYHVLFAVGRMGLTAPAVLVSRAMTADQRAAWFDAHVDTGAVVYNVSCVSEGAQTFAPWTVAQFVSQLNASTDLYLACEVGAYKAAPVKITADAAAGTVTLAETTRAA